MAGTCEGSTQPSSSHKRQEILWLTGRLLASQERLCSMALLYFIASIFWQLERYVSLVSSDEGWHWCQTEEATHSVLWWDLRVSLVFFFWNLLSIILCQISKDYWHFKGTGFFPFYGWRGSVYNLYPFEQGTVLRNCTETQDVFLLHLTLEGPSSSDRICKQEVSSLPVLVQELWVHIPKVTISELNLRLWSLFSYSFLNMIPGNRYSL